MKKIAMLLAMVGTVGMLTGCMKEEEHLAIVAGIEAEHAEEVDKLNAEIAAQKDLVKNEKAKVRSGRIELDDATERIQGLQQKSAETSKALGAEKAKVAKLESELKSSKSQTAAAQDQALAAEEKYSTLNVEYEALKVRFENFQNNLGKSSAPAASAPAGSAPEAGSAPKSDAEKAGSLLDQMGTL